MSELRSMVGNHLLVLPSVAVLPWDSHGGLLLVRQADSGQWATIGGAVEPDEAPQSAALREAAEEAGVLVELTSIRAVLGGPGYRVGYPNGDQTSYVTTVFDAQVTSGTPHPDGDEILDIGWFTPSDLANLDLHPVGTSVLQGAGVLPTSTQTD
jgi:8-oxo-dGTP pyrophosphatase MutT (NUDIX family)